MKKFIVSDLHGNGEVYNSIMAYLENVSLLEEVELYINGDLIDRGLDSFEVLEDVVSRIKGKGNIKINYLAGNHELMMYQAILDRKPGKAIRKWSNWLMNGGWFIEGAIDSLDNAEEVYEEYKKFLGNLKIYHKFEETIKDKNILLVHAKPPKVINDICDMQISDNNIDVELAVWTRETDEYFETVEIGKKDYFTIIGHTPVTDELGFIYNPLQNVLNIDGACAYYAFGGFKHDHVPLIEIDDGYINIIIFNHNNEIIDGYVFDGNIHKMSEKGLDKKKVFINHEFDNCREEKQKEIKKILEIN